MDERSPGQLKRDMVAAIGLMLLALAYGLKAQTIPGSSLTGKGLGADAVPSALAVAMGLFAFLLLLRSARALRRMAPSVAAPQAPLPPLAERLRPHRRALVMLAFGIIFVNVLDYTGYALAIALLLAATAWYNGQSKLKPLLLFAAGGAVVYDLLFVHLLNVTLPAGIWPSLFASLFGIES